MSLSTVMHVGDLEPPFRPVLVNRTTGLPYDLSTATSVKVTCTRGTTSVFSLRSATGNSAGQVNMAWSGTDTNTVGELHLVVVVEWTSGRVQTFPAEPEGNYFVVNVVA